MSKIVALLGGGDWNDASVEHLVIPDNIDLDKEKKAWNKWYYEEYCHALHTNNRIDFVIFSDWLIKKGARPTTEDELTEFSVDL